MTLWSHQLKNVIESVHRLTTANTIQAIRSQTSSNTLERSELDRPCAYSSMCRDVVQVVMTSRLDRPPWPVDWRLIDRSPDRNLARNFSLSTCSSTHLFWLLLL